jgi:hypothetical protein
LDSEAIKLTGTAEQPHFHKKLLSDTRQEYKDKTPTQNFHTWYIQAANDGEKRSDDVRMSGRPRVVHVLYTGLAS